MSGKVRADLVAQIVNSYVSRNIIAASDMPRVIRSVSDALDRLTDPIPVPAEKRPPAISVRKSITPDYLISLEDGKRYSTLKRHLTGLGLTPAAYRERWGLPADYPMVAPAYSAKRSALAKKFGLGRKASLPNGPG